jgi:hypothetical protein
MNSFNESDYSEYNDYNMALSNNQGPEQKMVLMEFSENPRHSNAGNNKGDSALTAFLRSNKKQNTLSGTQHTSSSFDTFAQEHQEWEDDDADVPDDEESIVSIDINDIKNDFIPLSSYKVPDDESIVSIDVNDINNDFIPASSYNEGAVDEALKWTEAFMAHDDDDESMEEAPLCDSMSSLNDGLEKLTKCMERSALSRQLITQYSEKSLGSSTSTTDDIAQHSFNHNNSLQPQQYPLGPSSSHSTSSGLVKPRIKKAQNITRSGLIRRHSHRSVSGQEIIKRGLVKKDSLIVSRHNGSLNSISFHGDSSWRTMVPRNSSFRKTKLSQETSRSPMDSSNSSLPVKARLSQNVKS